MKAMAMIGTFSDHHTTGFTCVLAIWDCFAVRKKEAKASLLLFPRAFGVPPSSIHDLLAQNESFEKVS